MNAKQTVASASLVVGVIGCAVLARAEPATAPPPDGQAAPATKKATGTFEVGAGYATDDGFVARATIAQANLFGTGDLLALDASISARRQLFDLRFGAPHVLDSDFRLDTTLYSERRILPGFARSAVGAAATLSHPLDDHVTAFATYRIERVDPTGGDDPVHRATDPTETYLAPHPYTLATLRAGLAYSTLDHPLFPLHGSSLGASIEVADPRLGSDLRYTRVDAYASTHQPLGPLTLHLSGRVAAIGSPDAAGVPSTERLFLDGSRDLPGFLPGALGPPVGGNLMALGRAELEVPLSKRLGLSLVGFYAAGSVYDWHGNGGIGQSAGIGLLWRSPLGPLRIDFAIPIGGGGAPGLVFGLGGAF